MRAHGYLTISGPDVRVVERDTVGCAHCAKVIVVKPGTATTVYLIPRRDGTWIEEPGAGCSVCMRPMCLPCHDIGVCRPVEKWLEIMESARA